jgi:hypothetical protein
LVKTLLPRPEVSVALGRGRKLSRPRAGLGISNLLDDQVPSGRLSFEVENDVALLRFLAKVLAAASSSCNC